MCRVTLELPDFKGLFVHIGQQATGALTVEAHRWYQAIAAGHFLGPRFGVQFNPIIPLISRRVITEPPVLLAHW